MQSGKVGTMSIVAIPLRVFEDRLSMKSMVIMGGSRSCSFHVTGDQSRHFLQFPPYRASSESSPPSPAGFPLGLEKWEGIFQSGKDQGIFADWKSEGKSQEILEISDKYYFLFLVIFKCVYYLLKWIKFLVDKKKTLKKYWKNV